MRAVAKWVARILFRLGIRWLGIVALVIAALLIYILSSTGSAPPVITQTIAIIAETAKGQEATLVDIHYITSYKPNDTETFYFYVLSFKVKQDLVYVAYAFDLDSSGNLLKVD